MLNLCVQCEFGILGSCVTLTLTVTPALTLTSFALCDNPGQLFHSHCQLADFMGHYLNLKGF